MLIFWKNVYITSHSMLSSKSPPIRLKYSDMIYVLPDFSRVWAAHGTLCPTFQGFFFFFCLICWHVSPSGPAHHSHYCWLWLSSLGVSLENSKEECSTHFQARSKILTKSVCCSQMGVWDTQEMMTISCWIQTAPCLKSQALASRLAPSLPFQWSTEHARFENSL